MALLVLALPARVLFAPVSPTVSLTQPEDGLWTDC